MMTIPSLISTAILFFSAENSGKSQVSEITSVGIYLDVPDYDQSAFALMEKAEEAMEEAFPGISWQTVDSAGTKALSLPAPLPLLGQLTRTKPDSQALALGRAASRTYGYSHLLLIQRGGAKATRDSSPEFSDAATFTLLDATASAPLFRHTQRSVGRKAAKSSAEAAWAQDAWKGFVSAWRSKPRK